VARVETSGPQNDEEDTEDGNEDRKTKTHNKNYSFAFNLQ